MTTTPTVKGHPDMLTATPNAGALAQYTASLAIDCDLDHLLPKEPWFHFHGVYLANAAAIIDGFLQGDWTDAPTDLTAIELHGAANGVTLEVAADIFGQDPDELALGGVAYLNIPEVGDLRIALAKATRDTDMFTAAHLYDPAAQITHVIERFCRQVDSALAPVDALLHRKSAQAA